MSLDYPRLYFKIDIRILNEMFVEKDEGEDRSQTRSIISRFQNDELNVQKNISFLQIFLRIPVFRFAEIRF